MNRIQRGFHRFGLISAVATLLLLIPIVLATMMEGNEDYLLVTAKKLSRIVAADCETGTERDTAPSPDLPASFELEVTCIKLGDGEILHFSPNIYSKQVEAAKSLLAQRQAAVEKAQKRVFAKNLAIMLGGSFLAALAVYGLFASIGWAFAGFAKD